MFRIAAFTLLAFASHPLAAQIHLPNTISDHAVLQRDKPIHVWGTAPAKERLTVAFDKQTLTAVSDEQGFWEVWLSPEHAGGPYTLTVKGETSAIITRTDLLVGDVWIASGQSNMEFPLKGFPNAPLRDGEKEIAAANHPQIRLFLQKRRTATAVMDDSDDTWTVCTPETAKNFSAVAYFFGREISEREHVPIGLIDTTWGGTPAHAWMSLDGIAYANLPSVARDAGRIAREQGAADALRARYAAEDAALKAQGKSPADRARIPNDHGASWNPGTLYNAMIAPFTRYTIKGAIWYQGETDATPDRAPNYERVLSALIEDWRRQWAAGPFPFLFVQISSFSNHDADWGTLRDGQRRVAENIAATGMAVTLDVGLTDNVHPPDKQTVAKRLALLALGKVYGEKIQPFPPTFVTATRETEALRVWFDHADGLRLSTMPAADFEIAGQDHKFLPATATVEGHTVLLKSPAVPAPVYARYGWKGTVSSYLYNAEGLPASTFTSEQ